MIPSSILYPGTKPYFPLKASASYSIETQAASPISEVLKSSGVGNCAYEKFNLVMKNRSRCWDSGGKTSL